MGELYCCSNLQRRSLDEKNKELIGKLNFTKKYVIGVGGFSKVNNIFYNIKIIIYYFRFGK